MIKKNISILAVPLSGFGVYLFDKVFGNQINWEKFRIFNIGELLAVQISILNILTFLIFFTITYFILKNLWKTDSIYSKKQNKLRKYNSYKDNKNKILFRWEVYFNYSENPNIANLEAFCDYHSGPPIRFINNRCPHLNCQKNRPTINISEFKNYIESDLINRWDKMK